MTPCAYCGKGFGGEGWDATQREALPIHRPVRVENGDLRRILAHRPSQCRQRRFRGHVDQPGALYPRLQIIAHRRADFGPGVTPRGAEVDEQVGAGGGFGAKPENPQPFVRMDKVRKLPLRKKGFFRPAFAQPGKDLMSGLVKSAGFGVAITVISCWQGFLAREGAADVGRRTTAAVVQSIFVMILLDLFFTALNYIFR